MRRAAVVVGALAMGLSLGVPSRAAADPLPTNDYTIDLFQGPLLAPLKIVGLAGAYAGIAEGLAAMVSNAAAPAVRSPYSFDWVSPDASGSLSFPLGLFGNNDFDNSGDEDYDYSNFVYITGSLGLQVGPVGVGVVGELQNYSITATDGASTNVLVGKYHALTAVSVFRGQLAVGAGARALTVGLDAPEVNLSIAGVAPQLGFLVRPDWLPFRVGATFRFPVVGSALDAEGEEGRDGLRRAGPFVLPRAVELPWELEIGATLQLGGRPLNPSWMDPREQESLVRRRVELARRAREEARGGRSIAEGDRGREARLRSEEGAYIDEEVKAMRSSRRARYEAFPRDHILFSAALVVYGDVDDGVSIERFLGQGADVEQNDAPVGSAGARVNFSPRIGIEAEPILDLLMTRLGTYFEPNRFGDVGRQHFTFGADLKLFSTTFWDLVPKTTYCASAALDIAPRYSSASVSIGVWH